MPHDSRKNVVPPLKRLKVCVHNCLLSVRHGCISNSMSYVIFCLSPEGSLLTHHACVSPSQAVACLPGGARRHMSPESDFLGPLYRESDIFTYCFRSEGAPV